MPLIEHLSDENPAVRWKTTLALAKFGKKAINPLKNALKCEDTIVREKAAETLGEIGDILALDDLKIATSDDNIYVKKNAEEAIRKIMNKNS